MSETTGVPKRSVSALAYGIVALAIAFQLSVVWLMLHPQVPADYRAYYIDQSTTCLNQPVSGEYVLGTKVSFLPSGLEQARSQRVCGWEGPAGDGTHAVGKTSRLRFAVSEAGSSLALELQLVAVEREGHPSQRIAVEANGILLATVTALAGVPLVVRLDVPPAATPDNVGTVEIALHFADAIRMSSSDSDTRLRSIKLLSAKLSQVRT